MKHDLQGLSPLIMSAALILGICFFSFLKYRHWSGPALSLGVLMSAAYILWLIVEAGTSVRDKKAGKTEKDKGTLEWYAFSQGGVILTALGFSAPRQGISPWMFLGLLVFASGVLFRQWAVRELGAFYSHRVRIRSEHQIIRTGPYRWVRHPAYSGMILAHIGVVLFFGTLPALVFLCLLIAALVSRIRVEEAALADLTGYKEFCSNKKRLAPLVW
ncbi:Protein-S-isoprenylcysteine O-methyltransferase Ste14 [Desulfatibacillum alkenivorans DSM 16219]|uniref:Protein-S-isoprenylcysteine O-methyltransferase Ste14 n=1 Tax=Desulfatibacillum alkenivorans DSM 16219 TaxID=1121393 RepID=A0A1M6IKD0_9BACT|nr:isoprenylcysteine carboxylmethyltransferase family protein [Desulfatibacillum alkenivorans]SHJ34931.1 Protein-S-isoprenylcysteine O-methyltransferase Ste14 [Desulfatibacillum alkenivorans DSM 16219]